MKMRGICRVFATALFTASAVLPKSAGAQDLLSGHIGVATPIVTYTGSNGTSNTTTIGNSFDILFPFGVGVRPQSSPVVFDFEFDPVIHPSTRSDTLLVQPGVILPLQDGWGTWDAGRIRDQSELCWFYTAREQELPVFSGLKIQLVPGRRRAGAVPSATKWGRRYLCGLCPAYRFGVLNLKGRPSPRHAAERVEPESSVIRTPQRAAASARLYLVGPNPDRRRRRADSCGINAESVNAPSTRAPSYKRW